MRTCFCIIGDLYEFVGMDFEGRGIVEERVGRDRRESFGFSTGICACCAD